MDVFSGLRKLNHFHVKLPVSLVAYFFKYGILEAEMPKFTWSSPLVLTTAAKLRAWAAVFLLNYIIRYLYLYPAV